MDSGNRRIIRHMVFGLCLLGFLGISQPALALRSVVHVDGTGPAELQRTVSERLTFILNHLDLEKTTSLQQHCTPAGWQSLQNLIQKTGCRNVNPLYETNLLQLASGKYEVRGIKVKVDMQQTKGNPFQYMVFTFTPEGKVDEVRYAMERHHYREIVRRGEELQDFAFRQQILHFIEIFRTAYNRKDLAYLRKVYSDDALIIVGKVLQERPDSPDLLEHSSLARDRIRFIRLSKQEYLQRLARVFQLNSFVKVQFEEVEVSRHPKITEIYGVTLKQGWRSSHYSDEGYLFLMIDFREPNNPLIHVRSWQPERFPDGSVVSLGDFELIE